MVDEETIYALSSGVGKAGVAVVRISGAKARAVARQFLGKVPRARFATFGQVKDPENGRLMDEGLALFFPGPKSFTGEDVVEFHLHGSRAVLSAVFAALHRFGLRPAEAGEFTQRAFRNGKMDLAQAEGLADLLDAETTLQHQQALGQLGGLLSVQARAWRERLLAIMMPLEAAVDFPDEADVPLDIERRARPGIIDLVSELERFLAAASGAHKIREGITVTLLGAPNVGKSSLLNFLAGSEKAIVSARPGTTRDAIEAHLELAGMAVTIIDTAGLRDVTGDEIEQEGMRRTRQKAAQSDMRIWVRDASRGEEAEQVEALVAGSAELVVLNKSDLLSPHERPEGLVISLKENRGTDRLLATLESMIKEKAAHREDGLLTRQRHVHAVEKAVTELKQSIQILTYQPDLAAENIRLAARALARITGAIDVEDVLGEIFSSFCIGK